MGQVVRIFDEKKLMTELAEETIVLIHATKKIAAIKVLITTHEVIWLNLEIGRLYPEKQPPWDFATLKELSSLRGEVAVRHWDSFTPVALVPKWYSKVGVLLDLMKKYTPSV